MANKKTIIKNEKADNAKFKRTAVKTKKINIQPMNTRGGTRLW